MSDIYIYIYKPYGSRTEDDPWLVDVSHRGRKDKGQRSGMAAWELRVDAGI